MKKKPIIIGIGEVLFDIFHDSRQMGGAPVNFTYHASRLGAESYVITAVGDDASGKEILAKVEKAGLGSIIETTSYPTGTVIVELNDGIPTYTITEGVAWDYIPLTGPMIELAARADAVCFGTLAQRSAMSRHTIREILAAAPRDSLRILDINLRQHYYTEDTVAESLRLSNVLKINDDELDVVRGMFAIGETAQEDICRWLGRRFDLKMVVLTAGASHSSIYTENESSTLPTPKVEVVDTVGAGDAFTGTLISALLGGTSLTDAHRSAVEKAAFVCTKAGAWPEYE